MENIRNINEDIFYVGASDRRLQLFENLFPLPNGVSYNSYVIVDDKTVLVDTADKAVSAEFFANIDAALGGRKLDYVIINHMEPDHAATLGDLINRYNGVKIVANAKTTAIIKQFFDFEFDPLIVKENDTLELGKHTLTFVMAPMVHWPEVMMTYDMTQKILFTADAFGMFGATDGSIFADEIDFDAVWQDDARRYYSNIVGKYGAQVQAVLKKASALEINMICPLHGPIWREDISWLMEKYDKWSRWEAETDDVFIVYGSMYGNTENAAHKIATELSKSGKKVRVMNICNTDKSYAVSEMFRAKNIVIASPTYNGGIYPPIEALVLDVKALGLKGRNIGIIENGTWAPTAARQISAILDTMKEINIVSTLTIKSSLKENQSTQIEEFCNGLKA